MADGPPPPGWAVHTSRSTNRQYYFNPSTGESSYENPARRNQPSRPVSPPMAAPAPDDYGISYAADDSSAGDFGGAGRVAVDSAAAAVATAYDQVKDVGRAARSQSELIYLRRFQNWVKSVLIMACAPRECNSVLDLACGKLGDLAKWREKGVRRYVGIDISSESLANGAKRFSSDNSGASMMTGRLVCADLGAVDLRCFPALAPGEQFDCISIQFALHYLFQSEARALTFFANIRDRLRPGGVFLGTIADSHALVRAMREEHARQMRETAVAPPEDKDPFFWQREEREAEATGEPGAKRPKTEGQSHASAAGPGGEDRGDASPDAGKAGAATAAAAAAGGKPSRKRPRSKAASRADDGSVAAEGTLEALAAKLAEPRPHVERRDPLYEAEGPARRAGLDVDALRIGSDFCHVTFPKSTIARSYAGGGDPFGMAYSFYLKEAVEHVTEYLVPPQLLERLARSVGLVPVEGVGRVRAAEGDVPPPPSDFAAGGCNFHQFFEAYGGGQGDHGPHSGSSASEAGVPPRDQYVRLLERMKVFDAGGTFNDAQWRAAGLYRVFAFRRDDSISPTLPVPAPRRTAPGKPLESATMLSRHSVLVVSPDGSCQGGGVAPLPPFEAETPQQRASRMPASARKLPASSPTDSAVAVAGTSASAAPAAAAAAAAASGAAGQEEEDEEAEAEAEAELAAPQDASQAAPLSSLPPPSSSSAAAAVGGTDPTSRGSAPALPALPSSLPPAVPSAPASLQQEGAVVTSAASFAGPAQAAAASSTQLPAAAEPALPPLPAPTAEVAAAPFEEPAAAASTTTSSATTATPAQDSPGASHAALAPAADPAASHPSPAAPEDPAFSAAEDSNLGEGGVEGADFAAPLDGGAPFEEPALPAAAAGAQAAAFGDIALAGDTQDEPLFSYAGGDDEDELE